MSLLKNKIKTLIAVTVFFSVCPLQAERYFDTSGLRLSDEEKKLLESYHLAREGVQVPGTYRVKIYVNKNNVAEEKINFILCDEKLCPVLSRNQLETWGVKIALFPALTALADNDTITHLDKYITYSSGKFDFGNQTLRLSIPQAALKNNLSGEISPEQWDDGIPFAFVNYYLSGSETSTDHHKYSNQYVNVNYGGNWGPWHVRSGGAWNRDRNSTRWIRGASYLERDIRALRARLTVGEISTSGQIMDSFNFTGITLASDSSMMPGSQQGFAPVIRGIAMTNSEIIVRQRGNIIYRTFVPAGAFEITDINAYVSSSNLDITIKEENGSERTLVQPFSSIPVLVRQGQIKYATSAGKYRAVSQHGHNSNNSRFGAAQVAYGLFDSTTLYGGGLASESYLSGTLGLGQGLGYLGAISADITTSIAEFNDGIKKNGQAYRLRYNKSFTDTATSITLTGSRYSTAQYYSFDTANRYYHNSGYLFYGAPKERYQIIVSQGLGQFGSLSLSGSQQTYWNTARGTTQTFYGAWNFNWQSIGIGLSYNNNRTSTYARTDQLYALNLSVPLSKWLGGNNSAYVNYGLSQTDKGITSNRVSLSGTTLADNNLSYQLSQSTIAGGSHHQSNNATNALLAYTNAKGRFNLGYSNYSGSNQRVNYGAQGALVAHPYGVTLAQSLAEGGGASVLVRALGASGVKVKNNTALYTDSRGYALVPYVSPYQKSSISLETSSLGEDVDVIDPIKNVVPVKGALALADYSTRIGRRVFVTLTYKGKKIPFGAVARTTSGATGMVNERGEVYLTGVGENERLKVQWGTSNEQQCSLALLIPGQKESVNGITVISGDCQ